ncbi:MAG TPA: YgiT-type zinc finger protein [Spirochaetota bacterium]|nr:YgiT-type zinc finger protein [Spirochaetota bacterium]
MLKFSQEAICQKIASLNLNLLDFICKKNYIVSMKCECGGNIKERFITYTRKFSGQLYVFENVPVGVCSLCGERVFKGEVLENLETISKTKSNFIKNIEVPVYSINFGI